MGSFAPASPAVAGGKRNVPIPAGREDSHFLGEAQREAAVAQAHLLAVRPGVSSASRSAMAQHILGWHWEGGCVVHSMLAPGETSLRRTRVASGIHSSTSCPGQVMPPISQHLMPCLLPLLSTDSLKCSSHQRSGITRWTLIGGSLEELSSIRAC
jgi:hypothetical protein